MWVNTVIPPTGSYLLSYYLLTKQGSPSLNHQSTSILEWFILVWFICAGNYMILVFLNVHCNKKTQLTPHKAHSARSEPLRKPDISSERLWCGRFICCTSPGTQLKVRPGGPEIPPPFLRSPIILLSDGSQHDVPCYRTHLEKAKWLLPRPQVTVDLFPVVLWQLWHRADLNVVFLASVYTLSLTLCSFILSFLSR